MTTPRLTPRLREARLALGLTQAALAAAVGITQGDYSHIERGTHAPSGLRKALAIARALGQPVEVLWPVVAASAANTSPQHRPDRRAIRMRAVPSRASESARRVKR